MGHPLHEIISDCFSSNEFPDCKIVKSQDCGGHQDVPLFCSKNKSRETRYCLADMLMMKDSKVRVIIEIEESDVKPTQICGKFLASALASHYIHRSEDNTPIEMGDSVLFIQVLDTSKLKENTSKKSQWENLEDSITKILPIGRITKYKLFCGKPPDLEKREGNKCPKLVSYIKGTLATET